MHTLFKTRLDDRASAPVPVVEVDEKDKKIQIEIQEWAWHIHQDALHDASQTVSQLKVGTNEVLLKRVSEEVTHKAEEERKKSVAKAKRHQP